MSRPSASSPAADPASSGGVAPATSPAARCPIDPQRSDDELLAYTLVQTWALTTGRALPPGLSFAELDEGTLINFWADPVLQRPSATMHATIPTAKA